MTLKRTMDATFLNVIANAPEVRPWLGGVGTLDLSGILANANNVALVNDHGGFVGVKLDAGLYECHSIFAPEGRGADVLEGTRQGLRYLFAATDCVEVQTKCPKSNPAATGLARAAGFSKLFERANAWTMEGGERCGVDYYGITFAKWRAQDGVVAERGVWFHERLEELTAAIGKKIPVHEDDHAHNRAVGAAVLMLEAGNSVKAIGLYNRWAALTGYPPASLISVVPPIIDMNEAVVAVSHGDMEVLACAQLAS